VLDDNLITDIPISGKDMLGIGVKQIPIPGMISRYEEHTVRIEVGYTIPEWYNLDPKDRALEVAVSRIKHSIEYQKSKAQQREAESNSKRR
jgi:hypothetical protein